MKFKKSSKPKKCFPTKTHALLLLLVAELGFLYAVSKPLPREAEAKQRTTITLGAESILADGSVFYDTAKYYRAEPGGYVFVGNDLGFQKNRGYILFDTTKIPDNAKIESLKLTWNVDYPYYQGESIDIVKCPPSTDYPDTNTGNKDYFDLIGASAVRYASNSIALNERGEQKIKLRKPAAIELERKLKSNTFSLCIREVTETTDDSASFLSSKNEDEDQRPSLTVTYKVSKNTKKGK